MESAARLVPALIRPAVIARWALALALTGCATGPGLVTAPPAETPAPERPPPATREPRAAPSREAQTGIASWYGTAHQGRRTASGEVYDMHALTAAHPSLPFGTRVLVTNVKSGRSVEVRINDRGPIVRGRIIDLSYAAARELGAVNDGAFRVKLRALSAPVDSPAAAPADEKAGRGSALDK